MTYDEAIEEMENIYQNGFDNDFDNDNIEKPLDAIRMAIRSLDKHIPKKPIQEQKAQLFHCYCPNCYEMYSKNSLIFKQNYCDECGQKIDWS